VSTTTSAARIARDLGARPTGPRYGLLMLATILSVAVQGIVEPGGPQQVAVTALAGAALLLAFRAADLAPRLVAVGAALAIVVVALSVVRAAVGGIGDGVALSVLQLRDADDSRIRRPRRAH
jgi:hypothetical protein